MKLLQQHISTKTCSSMCELDNCDIFQSLFFIFFKMKNKTRDVISAMFLLKYIRLLDKLTQERITYTCLHYSHCSSITILRPF